MSGWESGSAHSDEMMLQVLQGGRTISLGIHYSWKILEIRMLGYLVLFLKHPIYSTRNKQLHTRDPIFLGPQNQIYLALNSH